RDPFLKEQCSLLSPARSCSGLSCSCTKSRRP
ncbi:rCG44174, partial [Rattus norvegicus]